MKPAPCLSILGTGSDVGKSVIATALCRIFKNRGFSVAPFKAQNMSNNSGVTPQGHEMGRAQIVQAEAAGLVPHVDMNPVLLKPTSQVGSQVVLMGKALDHDSGRQYLTHKKDLFSVAAKVLDRLRQQYDLIILEGAGSCAEVNLLPHDIVNFRMAAHCDAPVIVVGDIHKGGIFAQLVGTLACLPKEYSDSIAGFIINRFNGDLNLFRDGVDWIEHKTCKKVFGVLPWYRDITIESEDSVVIESPQKTRLSDDGEAAIAVIRLPHISNFNDVGPLEALKGLQIHFLADLQDLDGFKAVILPGSKATRHDLDWLFARGWARAINAFAANGGHVLGLCGGYQMLGQLVADPDGIEGSPGKTDGLGLLPVDTVLKAPKTTSLTHFKWENIRATGYEIHMGRTQAKSSSSFCQILKRNGKPVRDHDGCVSAQNNVIGTYLHGMFDTPAVIRKWLDTIGLGHISVPKTGGIEARNTEYDRLADHAETFLDMDAIASLLTSRP
jgi:adenosylcobyric acid synthase